MHVRTHLCPGLSILFLNGKVPFICSTHGCPASTLWDGQEIPSCAPSRGCAQADCGVGAGDIWDQCVRLGWHPLAGSHIPDAFCCATSFGSVRLWPSRCGLGLGLLFPVDWLRVSTAGKFHLKMAS